MWVLLLVACAGPTVTGPSAMVGVVLDGEGQRVGGLRVASLESGDFTDADGRFSVALKGAAPSVGFTSGAVAWRRAYRPEDAGTEVVIRLPKEEERTVGCRLQQACDAELRWELGPLVGTAKIRCEPGTSPVGRLPALEPARARCGERDLEVGLSGHVIELNPPRSPVTVRLLGVPDGLACSVRVGGVDAAAEGSAWVGRASGPVTVSALCGDRPAVPMPLWVDGPQDVVLSWSPSGPDLDLRAAPERIAKWSLVRSGNDGWVLPLSSGDGVLRLPVLLPGEYELIGGSELGGFAGAPREPGVGSWRMGFADGRGSGRIRLEAPADGGTMRWEIAR